MPHNLQRTILAANAEAAAIGALLNNGWLRLMSGVQPANGDTAITTQTVLAELRFAATAFGAPVAGVVTAAPLTADPSANATGTATWARLYQADGTTAVMDGSVGQTGVDVADILLATTAIVAGTGPVSVASVTYAARMMPC